MKKFLIWLVVIAVFGGFIYTAPEAAAGTTRGIAGFVGSVLQNTWNYLAAAVDPG